MPTTVGDGPKNDKSDWKGTDRARVRKSFSDHRHVNPHLREHAATHSIPRQRCLLSHKLGLRDVYHGYRAWLAFRSSAVFVDVVVSLAPPGRTPEKTRDNAYKTAHQDHHAINVGYAGVKFCIIFFYVRISIV